jgi:lysophospholipase
MAREDLRVRAADGTSLRVGVWRPEGPPRFVVILSHGQSDNVARHAWIADPLRAEGGLVFGPDSRGEGQSGGVRGHVESYDEYARDLATVVDSVAADVPRDVPRIFFGHSTGALIGILYLLDHGPAQDISGAVLSSPFLELAMEVGLFKRGLARLANFVAPKLPIPGEIPPEDVLADPDLRRAYVSDPDRALTVTPRWVAATEAAQARAEAEIHRIQVPMLWYQGTADRIVKPEVTRRVFARLPDAADRDQVLDMIEGALHESHNEAPGVREPIRQRAIQWILDHTIKA